MARTYVPRTVYGYVPPGDGHQQVAVPARHDSSRRLPAGASEVRRRWRCRGLRGRRNAWCRAAPPRASSTETGLHGGDAGTSAPSACATCIFPAVTSVLTTGPSEPSRGAKFLTRAIAASRPAVYQDPRRHAGSRWTADVLRLLVLTVVDHLPARAATSALAACWVHGRDPQLAGSESVSPRPDGADWYSISRS